MPRPPRYAPADLCYHVINRGNGRATVFHKDGDYLAFTRILSLACERHFMRLLSYCLMPNHFHFVLWPQRNGDLPRMMQWLTTCHVRRYHRHYQGSGHVWQGRYKSFAAQASGYLLTLLRYVERNPVRAKLVRRAENWRWSSAGAMEEMGSGSAPSALPGPIFAAKEPGTISATDGEIEPDPRDIDLLRARPVEHWLAEGPIKRPRPWLKFVNRVEDANELLALRASVNRGAPFGEKSWQAATAAKLGVESSLRERGRPLNGSIQRLKK